MKVLLVQSYLGTREPVIFPLGLSSIAAALVKHDVSIYDPNTASRDPFEELSMRLADFRPDIVGISLRNIDNQERRNFFYYMQYLGPTLETIRRTMPDARIAVGGAGFSMFARTIMEKYGLIDFGIYLEGEESFPELLENLGSPDRVAGLFYRENGAVRFSGSRALPDFSRLPAPRKDLFDMSRYSVHRDAVGIQTKRGCAYRCCYCTYYNLNGNILRLRSPQHIVDEIETLVAHYNITSFMFADAIFNLPMQHAADICTEIIRRKLKVQWSCWCEPIKMTKEFLELAREAGCRFIVYSPDALSDSALGSLNKKLTRNDVTKVFRFAREIDGIRTEFGFFVSPPGETLTGLLSTLWFFIRGNAALVLKRRGAVGLNWIRIEPETMICEIAKKEGVIADDTDLLPDATRGDGLFYTQPSLRKYDIFVNLLLDVVDLVKGRRGKSITARK